MNDDNALEFLEQTTWLLNPSPNRRSIRRNGLECFPVGTRWIRNGDKVYAGDFSSFDGEIAEKIVAACIRVEPGFARRKLSHNGKLDDGDLQMVVGQLLDQGKISIADIEECLMQEYDLAEYERFAYRHWIRLDPPNENLEKYIAELKTKAEYGEE